MLTRHSCNAFWINRNNILVKLVHVSYWIYTNKLFVHYTMIICFSWKFGIIRYLCKNILNIECFWILNWNLTKQSKIMLLRLGYLELYFYWWQTQRLTLKANIKRLRWTPKWVFSQAINQQSDRKLLNFTYLRLSVHFISLLLQVDVFYWSYRKSISRIKLFLTGCFLNWTNFQTHKVTV